MNVYCVYAYPDGKGNVYPSVERIFENEDSAVAYMEEVNKKSGWPRAICVDRMKVEKDQDNMKFKTVKIIDCSGWDQLVYDAYNKPYNFQQQDGCKSRGTYEFTVPIKNPEDFKGIVPDDVEILKKGEYGTSFQSWLARHPKLPLKNQEYDFQLDLWWSRNFYPYVEMVIDDLHKRGILSEGKYVINIDW